MGRVSIQWKSPAALSPCPALPVYMTALGFEPLALPEDFWHTRLSLPCPEGTIRLLQVPIYILAWAMGPARHL